MIKDVSPAIVGVINIKANGLEDFYKVNHHPNLKKLLVLVSSIKSIIILYCDKTPVISGASEIKVQLHSKQVKAKLIGKDFYKVNHHPNLKKQVLVLCHLSNQ